MVIMAAAAPRTPNGRSCGTGEVQRGRDELMEIAMDLSIAGLRLARR